MTAPRLPKKSETLEIRLPYATKTAFMTQCREEGRTASDVMRGFIDDELVGRSRNPRSIWWQALAAASAGIALGAIAVPSVAQTRPMERAAFDRLDRDGNGELAYSELARR